MVHAMWIGAVTLVGGLTGLRRGWRRQVMDAGGCAAALVLAWGQHPRLVPYVQAVWPTLSRAQEDGPAVRQVALVYLFAALYGLFHVLVSLYVPGSRGTRARRWIAGLIGAIQAGTLSTLAVLLLPYA